MKTTLRAVVGLAVVGFLGCADSDRYPERQQVLTGVFADSAVSQLRYETLSQSGFTNDAGEFNYVAGERITFALGGIELGSAAAAEQVTPFDLVGLPAPTTEAGLRAGFNTPSFASRLERASNIAMFLVSLDIDRDLNNGIDLTGLDATLANATIDFNADLTAFPLNRLRPFLLTYDVGDQTTPITSPLAHLYDTVGIDISAHLASTVSTDSNGDGTIDSVTTNEYDALGHPTLLDIDSDNDGVVDSKTTSGFAGDRVITRLIQTQPVGDGTFHRANSNTYAYNSGGLITNQTTEVRDDGALTRRTVRAYTYDADSNQVTFHIDQDVTPVDGSIDTGTNNIYTYNSAGIVTSSRLETLANGAVTTVTTFAYAYDAANHLLTQVAATDNAPADGSFDLRTTETHVWDDSNHDVSGTSVSEGPIGTVTARSSRTSAYNTTGQITQQTVDTLDPADSTVTARVTTTNAYIGNVLSKVTVSTDAANDGTVDGTSVRTLSYDANGFIASDITDTDTDGDGTLDSVITVTNQFDADGNNHAQRTQTYTQATQSNTVFTTTTEFAPIADGIHALLYYYGVLGQL